ncbi:gibberellin 3-beta-dioxygenase 1 [Coffea arabica]|uniref:gibberellin 3beta-dioxygenase n=1 Tax=Coffea arabica TaxID=13443 RepID=A0A6P6TPS6_COFAR|nr:gibberellin 3-beta-dioxygenase 1-like [Coffea arabica]
MGTVSGAYKDVPMRLKHVIPLDFESTKVVPESHIWPETENFPLSDRVLPSDDDEKSKSWIPVIDLMAPNVVELIGHACETWGIFHLTNHGIPSSLIHDVESQARRLFSLPTEQKLKALRSADGATGYGAARMVPFLTKYLWHEGFLIAGSPIEHASVLWPHDHKTFCDVMETYQKMMNSLAHQLLLLMLKWLEVSEDELNWKLSMSQDALLLNSFPACPDPKSTIGLAPHTDSLLITILHQSQEGLQIFRDGFGWVTVSPIEGALVVNFGNLMDILSNGKFSGILHRAFVNQIRHRISVAYFCYPPIDSQVAPFAKSECPIYSSLTVKEYLEIRAKHMEDALSVIKIK